jgi:hypothetical protein
MARKRLTKGTNALRVEERIAKVPVDLIRSDPGSGVFEALKTLETKTAPAEAMPTPKAVQSSGSGHRSLANNAARRLGPDSFTKAERRAIVVSCTDYRNRLPIYLKSAMHDVEIIDSILRKCARFEQGSEPDRE